MKWVVAALLFAGTAPAWSDVSLLRDQLMASDPAVVSQATQEAETLSSRDKRMLVLSLMIPLRRDPASAAQAARALGVCGKSAEEALPDLIEAFRHDDPAVAQAVAQTLLKIGEASIRPLTKALEDPNFVVRQRAALTLAAFGPAAKNAAPALVELLQDSQGDVQTAAGTALVKIGDPAVPALASALKHNDAAGRQEIVRWLGRFGPAAVPALVQTLRKDDSSSVRVTAAMALAVIRPVQAPVVPALIEVLKDIDDNVRTAAVTALGQLGPDAKAAVGPLIVVAVHDSASLPQQRAIEALKTIGLASKESLPGLLDNLKNPDGDIRRASVVALGEAEVPAADKLPMLAIALKDHDAVQKEAIRITAELVKTEPQAVPLLRPVAADSDKFARAAGIAALGEAASAPGVAAVMLEDACKDPDIAVRRACIDSLAKLGPPAIPVLLREMTDWYAILAERAEEAILAMGPDAIPELEKAQASADPVIQKKIPAMIAQMQRSQKPLKSR